MVSLLIEVMELVVAALIVTGGSLAQLLLRKQPIQYTVFADMALVLLIVGVLGCVTLINN